MEAPGLGAELEATSWVPFLGPPLAPCPGQRKAPACIPVPPPASTDHVAWSSLFSCLSLPLWLIAVGCGRRPGAGGAVSDTHLWLIRSPNGPGVLVCTCGWREHVTPAPLKAEHTCPCLRYSKLSLQLVVGPRLPSAQGVVCWVPSSVTPGASSAQVCAPGS